MFEAKSIWIAAALLTAATLITSCGQSESLAAAGRTVKSCEDPNTSPGDDCSCDAAKDCTVTVACGKKGQKVAVPRSRGVNVTFQTPTQQSCRLYNFEIKDKDGKYPAQGWNGQTYNSDDSDVTYTYDGTLIDPTGDKFSFSTDAKGTRQDGSGTIANN